MAACLGVALSSIGQELSFDDPVPHSSHLTVRASALSPEFREYPEINFVFEKDGRVQDLQHAQVDTRVEPRGKLVIWLMAYNQELFERLNSYGLHAIQPHYARGWFSLVCQDDPVGPMCRGDMRLEAATGDDYSDEASIQKPDGMTNRALEFVKWLAREHPRGRWDYFLNADASDLRWEDVIVAGASHGSTTAARFAKHQRVSRVVMLCGPRDQYQTWQSLPSATPTNRFFGFSHVLDMGWEADHYCRSWELLGLNEHGPVLSVDWARPPYSHTRRLISSLDVGGDAGRAHSAVNPGRASPKDDAGNYLYEPVWRYLFTHPVDETGEATALDPDCEKDQR